MAHVDPLSRSELAEFEPLFQMVEGSMGFVPNSFLTMARWPELLSAFSAYAGTVMGPGVIEAELKQLIAFVVSQSAGCRYCQAHTSHVAEKRGASADKIHATFEFETSDLFSARERSALRIALHAGMVPNAADSEHFKAAGEHFDERELVEIVAVISLFGALNRWNDTLATSLEASPIAFAESMLVGAGWSIGKHGT